MVDLHCHILPGLDDGSKGLEQSLEMAESAIADGITHVVATPHSSSSHAFDYQRVRACRDELQKHLGDRLILATGCDFHMSPENLAALRLDAPRFCINQKNYLLVEFNEFSIPPAMDQALHELHLAGLQPVITHPERNAILRARPERLKQWVEHGSYVQVTANSLTGSFGPGAFEDAWRWIGDGLVHFDMEVAELLDVGAGVAHEAGRFLDLVQRGDGRAEDMEHDEGDLSFFHRIEEADIAQ